jgi:hypothetical protein
VTAKRLRAYRPEPHKPTTPPIPRLVIAPGHYDGDGCTFPDPQHLTREKA